MEVLTTTATKTRGKEERAKGNEREPRKSEREKERRGTTGTMSSTGAGYDHSPTVYSPDGRLYQVEYAAKAVSSAGTALGVKCKDGVILATEVDALKDAHEELEQAHLHRGHEGRHGHGRLCARWEATCQQGKVSLLCIQRWIRSGHSSGAACPEDGRVCTCIYLLLLFASVW